MSNLMRMLPVHKNEMPPLDEFVVTERNYKKLPQVLLRDWGHANPSAEYVVLPGVKADYRNIHYACKKPIDVEVVLDQGDIDAGYYITWED